MVLGREIPTAFLYIYIYIYDIRYIVTLQENFVDAYHNNVQDGALKAPRSAVYFNETCHFQ